MFVVEAAKIIIAGIKLGYYMILTPRGTVRVENSGTGDDHSTVLFRLQVNLSGSERGMHCSFLLRSGMYCFGHTPVRLEVDRQN